jgi:hypothetical protein
MVIYLQVASPSRVALRKCVMAIIEALRKRQLTIRFIAVRHEEAAAHGVAA